MPVNNQYSTFSQLGALPAAGTPDVSPIAGYDQQIQNSRMMGDQGYANLSRNYDQVTADALATRQRNMGRIETYGNAARQDLAIKNQQALAAANQSAIKRGLGNTTIMDSLARGQNFDNTRQTLTLEDQLLQNRISTDTNLSNTYQNALMNRAQGLASQWNTNLQNENQLTSNRLGYVGNLYSQNLQMQNQNEQAQIQREWNDPFNTQYRWDSRMPAQRGYSGGAFGGGSGGNYR